MTRSTMLIALTLIPLLGVQVLPGQQPADVLISERSIHGKKAGQQIVNSVGQTYCWCPPGSFLMGSPDSEKGRSYDEKQIDVNLSQGFWISKFEVTEQDYKSIRGRTSRNPSGKEYPVVDIRSGDGRNTAEKLTKLEHESGHLPKDWSYSLPTEAQWEYACRAGNGDAYSFGQNENDLVRFGNFADSKLYLLDRSTYRYANRSLDDGFAKVAPVGTYRPNAWGIHDMHGNVWEWCRDTYIRSLPGGTDPMGTSKNSVRGRVLRGGSWLSRPAYCRSAMRNAQHDLNVAPYVGFRLVIQPTGDPSRLDQ